MIVNADARQIPLAAGAVHCVVTSPPYWGLRDYGTVGQLGLEPTPEEYVANMMAVFREVWRVLRDDGTLWLNLGDSYATNGGAGYQGKNGQRADRRFTQESLRHRLNRETRNRPGEILKPKDLVGIPWRVAFALQADGWYLRSDVIWSKPNPMPESVTDRPTKAHEYLFLLAKSNRYFYDAEAIKDPATYAGKVVSLGDKSLSRGQAAGAGIDPSGNGTASSVTVAPGRNRRSVWEIATQPYPEAHFATFPEALVEPCVLAGTSERGVCSQCGAPWERVTERQVPERGPEYNGKHAASADDAAGRRILGAVAAGRAAGLPHDNPIATTRTTGWQPTCACAALTTHPLVLDPFAGSGTVGLVCHRLGRRFVGTDLKPDYCRMAYARTAQLGLV